MKKIVLTMMMLAAAGIGALQAQNNFSLRLGVALPTGDYADATADYANDVLRYGLIDNTKKGGAGKGITAGMQYKIGINSVKGLGVVLSADVFFNSVNTDVRDYFEEEIDEEESSTYKLDYTLPKYIHIPAMIGLNYTYDLNESIALFGEGALGANVRMLTKFEIYEATSTQERIDEANYNIATAFAFRLGGGIMLNKHYTIGIDYYNHGTSKVVGEMTSEVNGVSQAGSTKLKGGKIAATNIAIRLGINF